MVSISQVRNRKEALIPKETDEIIEVLSVVGDITNIMTIDNEQFIELSSSPLSVGSPDASGIRPRKRAKLDHLSMEEKAQHRKMMNRISAQSARDRQKAQMQLQEDRINELVAENAKLREKNQFLSTKCENLTSENNRLTSLVKKYEAEEKLIEALNFGSGAIIKAEPIGNTSACEGNGRRDLNNSLEPAVPRTVPLQKGPELLNNFSLLLIIWTCCQWISTQSNLSKHLMNSQNKSLIQEFNQMSLKMPSILQMQPLMRTIKLKEPG